MNESIKALRKALKNKSTFDDGTVVRWTAAGRFRYVAVYVEYRGIWYTSADNYYVAREVATDDLLEILKRSETTEVQVATGWESV